VPSAIYDRSVLVAVIDRSARRSRNPVFPQELGRRRAPVERRGSGAAESSVSVLSMYRPALPVLGPRWPCWASYTCALRSVGPAGPMGPIAPATPWGPCGPVHRSTIAPSAPCGPIGPVAPAGPVGPVAPCGRQWVPVPSLATGRHEDRQARLAQVVPVIPATKVRVWPETDPDRVRLPASR